MKIFKFILDDSRGKESKTLFFVTVSWLALLAKFLLGGFFSFPVISSAAFSAGVTAILAIWLGREWMEKNKK